MVILTKKCSEIHFTHFLKIITLTVDEMEVDKMRVDVIGVDKVGSRRGGNKPQKTKVNMFSDWLKTYQTELRFFMAVLPTRQRWPTNTRSWRDDWTT